MEPRYRAPRGTFDFIYPESEKVEALLAAASEILATRGYRRISTPMLESTELFRRGIGEATDIVTKEMYTFEDQGGESLSLRPEATAPVIRAYLERSLFAQGLPQKLFYAGPMFRRERPQAGRFRQFHQLGAEVIGTRDTFIDAEIISISDVLFKRLGLEAYELVVNSVGCGECRPSYVRMLSGFLEGISQALCEECRRRSRENPMRVFDCKNERCREALEAAPAIGEQLCPECRVHFQEVVDHLETLGVAFRVDPKLVRGLDYYTNTAFEFKFEGLSAQNTVSAGGRYDGLAEQLGGPETPGVGFSLGIERLLLALEAQGLDPFTPPRLSVFVAGAPGVERSSVLDILVALREAGVSADADFMDRGLKSQMKQADRLGARLVLIVGKDELERGEITIRDLDRSSQVEVSLAGMVPAIREMLEAGSEDV
jgi:histidyl-tRNA synthetase